MNENGYSSANDGNVTDRGRDRSLLEKIRRAYVWLVITTCLAIISVVVSYVMAVEYTEKSEKQQQETEMYKTALENRYQDAFYELMDSMNNIDVNLSKLSVSRSETAQRDYLTKIAMQSENAETNAAELPFYGGDVSKTLKFINQVGDYAKCMLKRPDGQEIVSDKDRETLQYMRQTVVKLRVNLTALYDEIGELSIVDITGKDADGKINVGEGFSQSKDETFEYPELIYDGPFSDGIEQNKGIELKGEKYSADEIKGRIKNILEGYEVKSVEYLYTVKSGENELYSFSVMTHSGEYYEVTATATGGYIMQMNSFCMRSDENEQAERDTAECIDIAEEFCKKLGYDVSAVWVSKTIDGYVYVNLCTIEEGQVIVYPDIVKVTVDTFKGKVIGVEALAYLTNHKEREMSIPENRAGEAQSKLGEYLKVKNVEIAVIPKNNEEILCYEFKCTDGENEYFVYINAKTLEEENILRVISGTEGYTVM